MRLEQNDGEELRERIYDPTILQDVMALAHDLQSRHQGKLTLSEIEGIGAELGLAPQYVREAVARVSRKSRQRAIPAGEALPIWHARALVGLPILWGLLTYLCGPRPPDFIIFWLIAGGPALLSLLLGFLARNRRRGIIASLGVLLAMAIAVAFSDAPGNPADVFFGVGAYALCASPFASGLALIGDWLRRRRAEPSGEASVSGRPELPFPAPPAG